MVPEEYTSKLTDLQFSPGIYHWNAVVDIDEDDNFRFGDGVMTDVNSTRTAQVDRTVDDIDRFAEEHKLEHVIVVYSGNTEANVEDVAQTSNDLLTQLLDDDPRVTPSTVYALAAATASTRCTFINTAAQNTITPGLRAVFAENGHRNCTGNDLSSGQTKLVSMLMDGFTKAALPVSSYVSLNTLGNSDGYKLRAPPSNRSKVVSKSSMMQQIQDHAPNLYADRDDIERVVSIVYAKSHGDNKRAYDEITIPMPFGRTFTIDIKMRCPDTMLAVGILIDLIFFAHELDGQEDVNDALSIFLKNPQQTGDNGPPPLYSESYRYLASRLPDLFSV
jgi:myo-inositol-1-phosphate synthase